MSVLEVRDLSIRFGGLQALQDVNLEVNEYEIVGLIGPNGAGKTTAFNCITGFYTPDTGTVTYRGQDVTTAPPHAKAAMGFGRTFQNVGMVKSATALENLKTAQHAKAGYDAGSGLIGTGAVLTAERRLTERADAILDLLGLQSIRDTKVGGLSYGTLKLLELGCALATDPDILLLDEPTSGMGPDESEELGDRLLTLRREFALTMLVIEHHVPLVLRVCDHVYVLNFGRLLAEGKPSFIQSHPEVVAAYLGGAAPDALAATEETAEDAELEHQLGEAHHAQHAHDGQHAGGPVDGNASGDAHDADADAPEQEHGPYAEDEYADDGHAGDQYAGDQYADDQYPDDRYADDRYAQAAGAPADEPRTEVIDAVDGAATTGVPAAVDDDEVLGTRRIGQRGAAATRALRSPSAPRPKRAPRRTSSAKKDES